jgi:hypothetical protein
VIPSQDYREMEVKPDHAALFDRLAAAEVLVLEYTTAGREAYEAANQVLIAKTDRLVGGMGPHAAQRQGWHRRHRRHGA